MVETIAVIIFFALGYLLYLWENKNNE
jgi:hypothetical protein